MGVRLDHSLAAALRINQFERALAAGLGTVVLFCAGITLATEANDSVMKRRQQGILTGMPFMANIASRTFVDDASRKLYVATPPRRVVSLAPSITEMLFALGLDEQIVGVTNFCNFPPAAVTKPKIGYTHPNLESLVALQPDIVVAPSDFLRADALAKPPSLTPWKLSNLTGRMLPAGVSISSRTRVMLSVPCGS